MIYKNGQEAEGDCGFIEYLSSSSSYIYYFLCNTKEIKLLTSFFNVLETLLVKIYHDGPVE